MGIAILGAGAWGTALAVTIGNNCPSERVWLWGREKYTKNLKNLSLPTNVFFTTDLNLTIENCRNLLITIPSNVFIELIKKLSSKINKDKSYRIVWATKGMDARTHNFFSESIKNYLPEDLPIAILAGPSFAQEVIDQKPTAVILAFAHKDHEFADYLLSKINSKNFRIYFTHDLIGVQLGGVFKNVLAVAVGICDGLNFGTNTRAALITNGINEILQLAQKLHADPSTLIGLSGIGDIILTCCSNQSRNYQFGLLLAKGLDIATAKSNIGQAIEALDNVENLYKLSSKHKVVMPILLAIRRIFHGKIPILAAVDDLLFSKIVN